MLLFTKYKCTWLTAISMSRLAALPAKMCVFNQDLRGKFYQGVPKPTLSPLIPLALVETCIVCLYSNQNQSCRAKIYK